MAEEERPKGSDARGTARSEKAELVDAFAELSGLGLTSRFART